MVTSNHDKRHIASYTVRRDATILEALRVIDDGAEAIAFVVDDGGGVCGSLSDGDIRRALIAGASVTSCCLTDIMHRDFAFVREGTGRSDVLDLMRARRVERIPVLDTENRLTGLHSLQQIVTGPSRENFAVILAGGRGTRLYPITETIPKPMLTVAGRPILERLVLHLMGHGIRRIFLSVNYRAELIEQHFGDGQAFGCRIEYLRETEPLGTGGPLSLLPPVDAPVFVMNGDLITQCDVGRMLDFHVGGGYVATFGVAPYSIQIPYGVASVDGDRLVDIKEKPTERMLVNAGMYVLSPEAVALVPHNEPFPITDLFSRCLASDLSVGAHVVQDDWVDVGRHDELNRARGGGGQ